MNNKQECHELKKCLQFVGLGSIGASQQYSYLQNFNFWKRSQTLVEKLSLDLQTLLPYSK